MLFITFNVYTKADCRWQAIKLVSFFARPLNLAAMSDHKIGNAAHSGASEVVFFTKSYKWKKQRWKKWKTWLLLRETMWFWRSPTVRQFKMTDRQIRSQQKIQLFDVAWKLSVFSLLFPCSNSFAERFVTCLRNKVHVFLPSYLLSSESSILYMNKTQVYSKKNVRWLILLKSSTEFEADIQQLAYINCGFVILG